ncbi:MAG: hypothetical protein PUA87_02705 [Oscillospiraceae bacterium]|nr:hypothetical protein [Oscillospiraceae bacterium]
MTLMADWCKEGLITRDLLNSDIDENWDAFVETVESMGIDEVIDAYATAGERYFGRLD